MIENVSIGIDIADITRFEKLPYQTNKTFYKKIFTSSEISYCLKHSNPAPHFAGKFAVKESIIKTLEFKIDLTKIETFEKNSKPMVRINDPATKNYLFKISISHEKNVAVGVALLEKNPKN